MDPYELLVTIDAYVRNKAEVMFNEM